MTCKGTLRLLYLSSYFVSSESGQIKSVKLQKVFQQNSTPPPPHPLPTTHCLYILYFDTGGGG
jgi:hypothetical protein